MWDTTTLREWLQAAAKPLQSFIKTASPSQRAVKVTKKKDTSKSSWDKQEPNNKTPQR